MLDVCVGGHGVFSTRVSHVVGVSARVPRNGLSESTLEGKGGLLSVFTTTIDKSLSSVLDAFPNECDTRYFTIEDRERFLQYCIVRLELGDVW